MDLQSLAWPCSSNIAREDENISGFGGTVLSDTSQHQPYAKPHQVKSEIQQIEKIEAPLSPKKETLQREREAPREQPWEAEELKTRILPSIVQKRPLEEKEKSSAKKKKKEKKTLF